MIGTDNLDNKILQLLGKKPFHPSLISRRMGIPVTTIQYRLYRLAKANLAKKYIVGRKSLWRPTFKKTHNKNLFKLYKKRDYIQGYNHLLSLPKGTLMLTVQGRDAAFGELANVPPLFIKKAHRVFKRKNIVMKGIFNDKSLPLFDQVDKDMINSHIGRPLGLKMLTNDSFLASGEVMSTENFLLLANPRARFVLIIKDRGITKVVNDVLELMFGYIDNHKTFDLNDYLKNKIATKPNQTA